MHWRIPIYILGMRENKASHYELFMFSYVSHQVGEDWGAHIWEFGKCLINLPTHGGTKAAVIVGPAILFLEVKYEYIIILQYCKIAFSSLFTYTVYTLRACLKRWIIYVLINIISWLVPLVNPCKKWFSFPFRLKLNALSGFIYSNTYFIC